MIWQMSLHEQTASRQRVMSRPATLETRPAHCRAPAFAGPCERRPRGRPGGRPTSATARRGRSAAADRLDSHMGYTRFGSSPMVRGAKKKPGRPSSAGPARVVVGRTVRPEGGRVLTPSPGQAPNLIQMAISRPTPPSWASAQAAPGRASPRGRANSTAAARRSFVLVTPA